MLSVQEHEELSRINTLAQFGELPAMMQARFEELRARDEQAMIPEPTLDITWLPRQRSIEDALDDRVDSYEDIDMLAEARKPSNTGFRTRATDIAAALGQPRRLSIADMAEFEAALNGDDLYATAPSGGFAPSTWYATH